MQLKEILSIEENRTEDSRGVIHLFQEGTFYRAYEWSAWLCHRYVHQFKVTHKLLGVLSHYRSKTLRAQLMCSMSCFSRYGTFDEDVLHYCPLVCSC